MAIQTQNMMKESLFMESKTKKSWQWIELVCMAPMEPNKQYRNNIDNVITQPSTLYTTPIYINPWNNIESFIAQPIFPSHIA